MDVKVIRVLVAQYKGVQKVRMENSLRLAALRKAYGQFGVDPFMKDMVEELKRIERDTYSKLMDVLEGFRLWSEWMSHVKGCGAVSAAYVIGWLDPEKPSPSHWWRYCGLAVVDGRAERRSRGEKAVYNPKLKTAMWNLSKSLSGNRAGGYRKAFEAFYKAEKEKQERMASVPVRLGEEHVGMMYYDGDSWKPVTRKAVREVKEPVPVKISDKHVYDRARRKTVKLFLSHAWTVWRLLEGKPVRPTYAYEKYGHTEYIMPVYDDEPKPDWWNTLLQWADKKGLDIIDYSSP